MFRNRVPSDIQLLRLSVKVAENGGFASLRLPTGSGAYFSPSGNSD